MAKASLLPIFHHQTRKEVIYVGWLSGRQEDSLNRAKARTRVAQRNFDAAGRAISSRENQQHLREMQRALNDAKQAERRAQNDFDRNMRR